jgi:hypothetical protein
MNEIKGIGFTSQSRQVKMDMYEISTGKSQTSELEKNFQLLKPFFLRQSYAKENTWQPDKNAGRAIGPTFRFFNRLILAFTVDRLLQLRNALAALYIRGTGYEIGNQCSPLRCRKAEKISYIDYLTREEDCVVVYLIAEANDLSGIPAQSADFHIANHVFEHSPDPVGSLMG